MQENEKTYERDIYMEERNEELEMSADTELKKETEIQTSENSEKASADIGFVGEDFLYGLAHSGDQWIVNGRLEEVPMYALEIFGSNGEKISNSLYGSKGYKLFFY